MAITTTLYYPADVLPGPLKDGFGMKPKSPVKITELVTGRKRIRRGYTSVPTETDVAGFLLTRRPRLLRHGTGMFLKTAAPGLTCRY